MMRGVVVFGLGVATALAAGWFAFPRALYFQQRQPLEFRHKTHVEKSGLVACQECHTIGEDGSFRGIPLTSACAGCHAAPIGTSKAEAALVAGYLTPRRETPWLEHARQPANVWFSHVIHTRRARLGCAECHAGYGESDSQPRYQRNRISGYSRTVMAMSVCEDCHRQRHVAAGCLGCHK